MCGNKGNDKNKINCQCDGNCDCGTVLPNGEISCDNCGWKAPQAYNTLTGNYTCPTCRTESSYSNNNVKPKNNNMNNNNGNISQGLVGLGAVNAGFLNWSEYPLGKPKNGNTESNFAKLGSQNMMGYATGIGQGFMLNPFGGGGESNFSQDDKNWANVFDSVTAEFDAAEADQNGEESGLTFGQKLQNAFTRFTPQGIIIRASWSNKYCKALGYMRSADKNGFKRCIAATKINFANAKSGKWKYPVAPEGAEESIDLEKLAAESAKESATMPPAQKEAVYQNEAVDAGAGEANKPAKSNVMMYVIIGVVVLAIIIAIIIMMRKRSVPAA